MTANEILKFMVDNPGRLYKVWATAHPEARELVEYRFPGISFTGYFIGFEHDVSSYLVWLNVQKIEVW